MGKTTDQLVALAGEVSQRPHPREMDMLLSTGERISAALCAMAIEDLGHHAVSLTGSQAGIVTDTVHTKAKIVEIRPRRIEQALAEDGIVLVAGFQGVSTELDVTTLGRGGSDTTAVALAAALGGDCEIYTDVDGVFTADPRIVPTRPQAGRRLARWRCSRWPAAGPRCSSCGRSSSPVTTACRSTYARRSRMRREPGFERTHPWRTRSSPASRTRPTRRT